MLASAAAVLLTFWVAHAYHSTGCLGAVGPLLLLLPVSALLLNGAVWRGVGRRYDLFPETRSPGRRSVVRIVCERLLRTMIFVVILVLVVGLEVRMVTVLDTRLEARAEQGNPDAQFARGMRWRWGARRTLQERRADAKWVRRAAEQGHPYGGEMLVSLYRRGGSLGTDYVEAYKWHLLGTGQLNEPGTGPPRWLAEHLTDEEIAEAKRRARLWRPKSEGQVSE